MKQNWAPNVFTEHNIQSKNVLYPVPAAGTRPGGLPVPAAWTTYQFPSLPKSCNIISSAVLVSEHRHLYASVSQSPQVLDYLVPSLFAPGPIHSLERIGQ